MTGAPLLPRGVVYTATGKPHYLDLAIRSARSLRQHNPGLPVDLLTDRPPAGGVAGGVFDRVRVDPALRRHAKLPALAGARFERTLCLDSDTVVLAPLGDVLDVLDRFDIALAHDQFLSNPYCRIDYRKPLPAAFPQFNSGLVALRRSPRTLAFLEAWAAAIADHGIGRDQPSLRELLWDSDLRIATLPPEYNLMNLDLLRGKPLDRYHAAPRLIHNPHFHLHHAAFADSPDPATDSLGLWQGARLAILLREDTTLPANRDRPPGRASRLERLGHPVRMLFWILPRLPRALRFNLRYRGPRALGFLRRLLRRGAPASPPPPVQGPPT